MQSGWPGVTQQLVSPQDEHVLVLLPVHLVYLAQDRADHPVGHREPREPTVSPLLSLCPFLALEHLRTLLGPVHTLPQICHLGGVQGHSQAGGQ